MAISTDEAMELHVWGPPQGLAFWEQLRTYLQAFPPPDEDAEFLDLARRAGLLEPTSPFADLDRELVAALTAGAAKGKELIESIATGARANAAPGPQHCTCSTTTSTASAPEPSTRRSGESPTARRPA
jgi:hypothetical protein